MQCTYIILGYSAFFCSSHQHCNFVLWNYLSHGCSFAEQRNPDLCVSLWSSSGLAASSSSFVVQKLVNLCSANLEGLYCSFDLNWTKQRSNFWHLLMMTWMSLTWNHWWAISFSAFQVLSCPEQSSVNYVNMLIVPSYSSNNISLCLS